MFGLGWQEILLILVVAVLVIGPEQIPQVARMIAKLMAQFRRATNELRDAVNTEVQQHQEFKDFQEFQSSLNSEVRGIGQTAQNLVEQEVEKEEAVLKQLEADVEATGGDPGPLTEDVPTWSYGAGSDADDVDSISVGGGDTPDDSGGDDHDEDAAADAAEPPADQPGEDVAEGAQQGEPTAEAPADTAEPVERSTTRKELA